MKLFAIMKKDWLLLRRERKFVIAAFFTPMFFLASTVHSVSTFPYESAGTLMKGAFAFQILPLLAFANIAAWALIAGILAVDFFCGETEHKTLEPTLAAPVSPIELASSKVLAAAIPAIILGSLFLTTFVVVAKIELHVDLFSLAFSPSRLIFLFSLLVVSCLISSTFVAMVSRYLSSIKSCTAASMPTIGVLLAICALRFPDVCSLSAWAKSFILFGAACLSVLFTWISSRQFISIR